MKFLQIFQYSTKQNFVFFFFFFAFKSLRVKRNDYWGSYILPLAKFVIHINLENYYLMRKIQGIVFVETTKIGLLVRD